MGNPISTETQNPAETRSHLVAATISPVTAEGEKRKGPIIGCTFNPYEYTVSKSNSYSEKGKAKAGTKLELQNSGPQTLQLTLIFDSLEGSPSKNGASLTTAPQDVSLVTEQLWELMEPIDNGTKKAGAPFVMFKWGIFQFLAVITNMTQKFTLFDKAGTPLRANVTITFSQHQDRNDYDRTNPTSGGGPAQQIVEAVSGDRLDSIAAQVYGDASKWKQIAEYNNLSNPLALQSGQRLAIPEL